MEQRQRPGTPPRPGPAHPPGAATAMPGMATVTLQPRRDADDDALVALARTGDTTAFARLVERHQDRAYAVALRITRSTADAAEAVQDGLVRCWRALPAFRGDAAFSTWLHRVIARVALDRAEALAARQAREVGPEAALEEPAETPVERDPAMARRLEALLATLSPAQRAVVTLFYLGGQPVDAVASALSLPNGTVKTLLHRARAVLRRAWLELDAEVER